MNDHLGSKIMDTLLFIFVKSKYLVSKIIKNTILSSKYKNL